MPAIIERGGRRREARHEGVITARPIRIVLRGEDLVVVVWPRGPTTSPTDGGCSTAVYVRGPHGLDPTSPSTSPIARRDAPWSPGRSIHAPLAYSRIEHDEPVRALTNVRVDTIRFTAKPKSRLVPFVVDQRMLDIIESAERHDAVARSETFVDLPGLGTYKFQRITRKGEHYPVRFFSEAVTFALNPRNGAAFVDLKSIALWDPTPLATVLRSYAEPWSALIWGAGSTPTQQLARYRLDRLDICRDFQFLQFGADEIQNFTTRARKREYIPDGAREESATHHSAMIEGNSLRTLYLGKGSPIMMRTYDKSGQIRATRTGGEHYRALWVGFDAADGPVRRVEFQLVGEEALTTWRATDMRSVDLWLDDARSAIVIDELWSYLTREWAVLRRPSTTDSNLRRATVDPRWAAVQQLGRPVAPAVRDMMAIRERVQDDLLRRRLDLACAYLMSFAAMFDPPVAPVSDADLVEWAFALLRRGQAWRSRELRLPHDELLRRVAEKRRYLTTVHQIRPLRG